MNTLSAAGLDVSRETIEKLKNLEQLVKKWNPAINLVSKSTAEEIWERHIVDSAQLFSHQPVHWDTWVDLGSGGGFPGVVIAILADELCTDHTVKLVESDGRKASFLRTAIRETETQAEVVVSRIEKLAPQNADVISARALAPLPKLLSMCSRHLSDSGTAILLKGANWKSEVEAASNTWTFAYEAITSVTQSEAVILKVDDIRNA